MSTIPASVSSVKLVLVDVQARLVPAMSDFEAAANRIKLLLSGAKELALPVIATEQYPQGLGNTLPEFAELLPENTPVIAKTGFSVFQEPEFIKALEKDKPETLIFCGDCTSMHKITVSGLETGCDYVYEVIDSSGKALTPRFHFRTAPADDAAFSFAGSFEEAIFLPFVN